MARNATKVEKVAGGAVRRNFLRCFFGFIMIFSWGGVRFYFFIFSSECFLFFANTAAAGVLWC